MHDVAAALGEIANLMRPVGSEQVPLEAAGGRVLREDVIARVAHPGITISSMDGYAVRHQDTTAGARLHVGGVIYAGPYSPRQSRDGECLRVFTGSPLPTGADAVVLQENVERREDYIVLRDGVEVGDYVQPGGSDFEIGDTLLAAPRRLTPEDIALAAAANYSDLIVAKSPRILIVPSGDELVLPGATLQPGQVVASSGFGVEALLRRQGATPILLPPVADDVESLRRAITAREVNATVTLGGASVGDRDFIGQVLAGKDITLAFQGVSMRPGKPTLAGRMAGCPLIGLPGNPVSALVCAQVFLRPAVDALLGLEAGPLPRRPVRLGADLPANGNREHYMRAKLDTREGMEVCLPFAQQSSSLLHRLARADALAVLPPAASPRASGDFIECIDL